MFLLPSHGGSIVLYIQPRSHMIFVLCVKCISCGLGFYCIFKGSTGLPYKLFEASSVVNFPLWLLFGKLIQQPHRHCWLFQNMFDSRSLCSTRQWMEFIGARVLKFTPVICCTLLISTPILWALEPPIFSLEKQLLLKSLLKSYYLIEWCFFLLSLCKYSFPIPSQSFLCVEIITWVLGTSPGVQWNPLKSTLSILKANIMWPLVILFLYEYWLSGIISISIIVHDCFVKCANDITYAALFDLFPLVCTVIKSIVL